MGVRTTNEGRSDERTTNEERSDERTTNEERSDERTTNEERSDPEKGVRSSARAHYEQYANATRPQRPTGLWGLAFCFLLCAPPRFKAGLLSACC
jgi:hypothetical protein